MSVDVFISIGSNVADSRSRVVEAMDMLRGVLEEFQASAVYSTESVSGDGTIYSNAVVRGRTDLSVGRLDELAKEWELKNGRTPEARRMGVVPVDIDVVVVDGRILRMRDYNRCYFKRGFGELTSDSDH